MFAVPNSRHQKYSKYAIAFWCRVRFAAVTNLHFAPIAIVNTIRQYRKKFGGLGRTGYQLGKIFKNQRSFPSYSNHEVVHLVGAPRSQV